MKRSPYNPRPASLPRLAAALAIALAAAVAAPALAQSPGTAQSPAAAKAAKTKARAFEEIDRRIGELNRISSRLQATKKLGPDAKAALSASVQGHVAWLSDLKDEIKADADPAALAEDAKAVAASYKAFALLLQKARATAAADRALHIADLMDAHRQRLAEAVAEAERSGKNASLLKASLADMERKLEGARQSARAASALAASLAHVPGDPAAAERNRESLQNARAKLRAASADLRSAWQGAITIQAAFKAMKWIPGVATSTPTATASATSTVSATGTQADLPAI